MISMCLVTGFLGCGKTTLLRNIIATHRDRKLIYLVNEFCAVDMDGALIAEDGVTVATIPGGSIFCKCLVTQFMGQLHALAEQHPDAEGLVIEASGMARPGVVETMLQETRLDQVYTLTDIITVVNPPVFLKLQHILPAVKEQVQSADVILVNKVDECAEPVTQEAEQMIRGLNPRAVLHRTVHAKAPLRLFERHGPGRGLVGDYALCRDPDYASHWIPCPAGVDVASLRSILVAHLEVLYRAKGFVTNREGNDFFVDVSGNRVQILPAGRHVEEKGLAVIARGGVPEDRLEKLRESISLASQRS